MHQTSPGLPLPPARSIADKLLKELAGRYGTPLYIYDAAVIRRQAARLDGFEVVRYAVKANSNLSILRLMRTLGCQIDVVSAGEIIRALKADFNPVEIVFTADLFDQAALELLAEQPIHVNIGSADMIEQYAAIRPGSSITMRINPGFGHGHDKKVSTGGEESKHGIWHRQLQDTLQRALAAGLKVTGVHIHIGSGSDFDHLSRIRKSLAAAARTIGAGLEIISAGGGLPVPYRPGESDFDIERYTADWQATRTELETELGRTLTLEVEPGRYLVAEAGLLLAEVRAVKTSGRQIYILGDAGFNDLVRPAMYGAYHPISIIGREDEPRSPTLVGGPICESADLFTQGKESVIEPQPLPRAQVGDLLCIHHSGAYGASMSSLYNSRPLAAEVLVDGDSATLIRRRQTWEEMLAPEE